jgi:predicted  nucleic acid-binding Zn-ribbon protein
MSERDRGTERVTSADGVTVEQRYTDTEFELPSVVFTLTSEREEPVEVRFVVPDIDAERVGFHPRFRNDGWVVDSEQLVFEAAVDPGEEMKTLYALDTNEWAVFERAIESLSIELVAPLQTVEPGQETVVRNIGKKAAGTGPSSKQSPDAVADEGQASDGGEVVPPETAQQEAPVGPATANNRAPVDLPPDSSAAGDTPSEDSGPAGTTTAGETPADGSLPDDSRAGDTGKRARGGEQGSSTGGKPSGAGDTAAGGRPDSRTGQVTDRATDALVEELLDRLDDGDLSPVHRDRLAQRVAGERGGADRARLASLQTRVSDIEAFTDPIEQLLDQHGPPAPALDAFEERLAAVETLEERVEELEERVETVDDHDEHIEHLDDRVETVDGRVGALGDDLEADLASVESEIETVQERLGTLETAVETAREEASGASERAEGVEESLATVEKQLDGLETQLEGFADDWESVEENITALQEWRTDLAQTFDAFDQ